MAQDIKLEIQGDGTHFTFDVEGTWHVSQEMFWKTAAQPPELTAVRETFDVRGARVVGADIETFWDAWTAFRNRLLRRDTGFPIWVRLRRLVGTGAPATEYLLGDNDGDGNFSFWQGLTVETIDTRYDDVIQGGTWRRSIVLDLRFSAMRVFPDGNGIVGWQQEVSNSYDVSGLHTLEWRTTITVGQGGPSLGTDARTVAQTHAKIPRASYGTNYVWQTNGPDGIDFETDDADEANSRIPTRVVAVSRIRQVGVDVGSTDSGAAPGEVHHSVEVVIEGRTKTTTTRARAVGPNAALFVASKKPAGDIEKSRSFEEYADPLEAEAEWVQIEASAQGGDSDTDAEAVKWEIQAEVTGGDQDFELVAMSSPFLPELSVGPWRPAVVTVTVTMTLVKAAPKPADMPFPAILPSPLILDRNASSEDAVPRLVKAGTRDSQNTWQRSARLVYRSRSKPPATAFDGLYTKPSVRSYLL